MYVYAYIEIDLYIYICIIEREREQLLEDQRKLIRVPYSGFIYPFFADTIVWLLEHEFGSVSATSSFIFAVRFD